VPTGSSRRNDRVDGELPHRTCSSTFEIAFLESCLMRGRSGEAMGLGSRCLRLAADRRRQPIALLPPYDLSGRGDAQDVAAG
jgi:hypothetical protein